MSRASAKRRVYGVGEDGRLTRCEARPENYGRPPCYHGEHVELTAEEADARNDAAMEASAGGFSSKGDDRSGGDRVSSGAGAVGEFEPVALGGGAWRLDAPCPGEADGPLASPDPSGGDELVSAWRVGVGASLPVRGADGAVSHVVRVTGARELDDGRFAYTGVPYVGVDPSDVEPDGSLGAGAARRTVDSAAWVAVGRNPDGSPVKGVLVEGAATGESVTVVARDGSVSHCVLGKVHRVVANGTVYTVGGEVSDGPVPSGKWAKYDGGFGVRVKGGKPSDTVAAVSASGKRELVVLGERVPGKRGLFVVAEHAVPTVSWMKSTSSGEWVLEAHGMTSGDVVQLRGKKGDVARYRLGGQELPGTGAFHVSRVRDGAAHRDFDPSAASARRAPARRRASAAGGLGRGGSGLTDEQEFERRIRDFAEWRKKNRRWFPRDYPGGKPPFDPDALDSLMPGEYSNPDGSTTHVRFDPATNRCVVDFTEHDEG